MTRYSGKVAQSINGVQVPVTGATVYVYDGAEPTAALEVLTDDFGLPLSNPVTTDTYGDFYFNSSLGAKKLDVHFGGERKWREDIFVGAPEDTPAVTVLRADLGAPSGSALQGFAPIWNGAITRTVQDKLRDLPHLYDLILPANRSTSYNAAAELTAALASGERFVLPQAEVRFSGTLNLTANNGGFIGQGKGSRLVTTSATGDIFLVGDGTNEISGTRFEGFTLFSTVTRTSGHAFNCRKITDAEMLYVRVGSRDDDTAFGNRHFAGYYFDRFSDVDIYGGEIVGQNVLVKLRGNADQTFGAECTMGGGLLIYRGEIGVHVGGGCGGVKMESMDVSAAAINLLIDQTLQPGAFNREVIISPACSIDSPTGTNIVIDQTTAAAARFLFRGNWSCGGAGDGIWIKNANECRVLVAAHLYGNGRDGLRLDDASTYVTFTGEADLNAGYGINPTVATTRLHIAQGALLLGNGLGGFNKTANALLYTIPDGSLKLPAYTVANLPPAAQAADSRAVVSDATARTFDSIVAGGGTSRVPVWCDGANWRIG